MARMIERAIEPYDEKKALFNYDINRWCRWSKIGKMWSSEPQDFAYIHQLVQLAKQHKIDLKPVIQKKFAMIADLEERKKQSEKAVTFSDTSEPDRPGFFNGYLWGLIAPFDIPAGIPSWNMRMIGFRFAKGVNPITGCPLNTTVKTIPHSFDQFSVIRTEIETNERMEWYKEDDGYSDAHDNVDNDDTNDEDDHDTSDNNDSGSDGDDGGD